MSDAPKQDETTTATASDDDQIVQPNSMNPHVIPEKDETTDE